jgi:hypothetical protein
MKCPMGIIPRECRKEKCQLWMALFQLGADGKPILDEKGNPKSTGNCSFIWNATLQIETKNTLVALLNKK